jgi:membrane fusion protein (multidrug efflux system)
MKAKKIKSKKIILTALAIGVVILCSGAKIIYSSWCQETTDDAYIDGNILPLRTAVTGYIDKVLFKDNQKVNKGDTLIVFDTVSLKSQIMQAEAQVASADAELQSCKKQILVSEFDEIAAGFNTGSTKENVAAAKTKVWQTEKDFQRIQRMYQSGAATQQTYDNVKAAWQMAKAQEGASHKQFNAMTTQKNTIRLQTNIHYIQIKQALAHVKQAEAQLTFAKDQYKHAFVTAPCNGIISKKNIEIGQFVPSGTALASLINTSDIWITANFKETQLEDMKSGQPAEIKIDAYPGLKLAGKIESFCAATNSKFSLLPAENATGNFIKITQRIPVRIHISNNNGKKPLLPGMNAVVSVNTK